MTSVNISFLFKYNRLWLDFFTSFFGSQTEIEHMVKKNMESDLTKLNKAYMVKVR